MPMKAANCTKTRALVERTMEMAKLLVAGTIAEAAMVGGGRKGPQLDVNAQI